MKCSRLRMIQSSRLRMIDSCLYLCLCWLDDYTNGSLLNGKDRNKENQPQLMISSQINEKLLSSSCSLVTSSRSPNRALNLVLKHVILREVDLLLGLGNLQHSHWILLVLYHIRYLRDRFILHATVLLRLETEHFQLILKPKLSGVNYSRVHQFLLLYLPMQFCQWLNTHVSDEYPLLVVSDQSGDEFVPG